MASRIDPKDESRLTAKAAKIARDLKRQIFAEFISGDATRPFEVFNQVAALVDRYAPAIQSALYASTVSSFVLGGQRVVLPIGASDRAKPLPPGMGRNTAALLEPVAGFPSIEFPIIDAAVRTLEDAGVVDSVFYYSLSNDAKRNAFTITADVTQKTLEKVREILSDNAEASGSRTQFMDRVRDAISDLPISEAHLEQVFRNNVNGAYSDGGEAALADPFVSDAFPYRAYYPIRDDRARPEHLEMEFLGLDGTNVYHYKDPVWQMFRPPWDWNCRCGWNPLTVRRAAAKGVRFAQQWLETGIEPAGQNVAWPEFRPSLSWQRIAG